MGNLIHCLEMLLCLLVAAVGISGDKHAESCRLTVLSGKVASLPHSKRPAVSLTRPHFLHRGSMSFQFPHPFHAADRLVEVLK